MTDISGLAGSAAYDTEPNAAQALLSMAAPPLVPDDAAFTAPADEASPIDPANAQPERRLPKASWLDAMPPEAFETAPSDPDHISSVNSDDNGLYRMFIGVSP
ncbi:hypothetical protein BS627_19405 [Agrobacterium salinitolerans]|jgi:hypothetical protein|uniref:Uncharacterized protein n=1 Tax=Agrobacterium salinitolerans TaxID=1183413 RepID=A0A9X3KNR4_9HYPH|nr:hypothetical protein [Agrobacterium salinitolerans]PNQ21412.1 hypothetical protein C2E26_19735 [Rhizobium sp. YIC5082]MCZ7858388.1 hypothetical protein [Agrobacterium salinitolerans]MCZ7938132.1 hypothetical protein [Agrobacterium salinitolerans]NTA39454.1 hypothetical protein [Agrobacterium salinitolerans]OOO18152.1 hypothetical protein BS627_19405 [Agrobacterium salinitolerans]